MHLSIRMGWIRFLAAVVAVAWGLPGLAAQVQATSPPTMSFSISPSVSQLGSSSRLTWSSVNANSCTFSGALSGTVQAQSGSNPITVEPTAVGGYTYNLDCTGPGGSVTQSATLQVKPLPLPIMSYSLSPAVVPIGSGTTLIWASAYASSCTLSGAGSGNLASQSSSSDPLTITPGATGSYTSTITCTGSGGSVSKSATLQVTELPPTLSIAVTPPIIQLGGDAKLIWSSANASSCTRSGAWSGAASTGNISDPAVVSPSAAGTYSYGLSCTGSGGTINQAATLQVTSTQDVQFLDAQIEAAQQTANNASATSSCGVISQNKSGSEDGFYWEIGNDNGIIADSANHLSASGSVQPAGTSGTNYTRGTQLQIDSASKWLYGSYVAETKAELTDGTWQFPAAYLPFLHFTSGYANMMDNCLSNQTVQQCLADSNGASPPVSNGTKTAADTGLFDYNSGHLEVFEGGGDPSVAGVMNGANNNDAALASEITTALSNKDVSVNLSFVAPDPAAGVQTTSGDYAAYLQGLLRPTDPLVMRSLLSPGGTDPYAVCTNPYNTSCVNGSGEPLAVYSPMPGSVSWQYSITHWIEDDPVTGDGSYSSPGKSGFYPWVDATRTYYGIVARYDTSTGTSGNPATAPFYLSTVCGAAIRGAFMAGTVNPALPAPADLAITSTGAGSVALSWTAASGASDYYVYYGTTSGGETTKSAAATGTSTTITGLSSTTKYYFVVKAYSHATALTSQPSNEVSALANTPFSLAAPTNLTATATASAGQVTLNWSAAAGASDYYVFSTAAGASTVKSGAVTATSTTVTGLTSGTEYSFVIEAYNHANGVSSGPSSAASATPN